jgi:hypothetical protein
LVSLACAATGVAVNVKAEAVGVDVTLYLPSGEGTPAPPSVVAIAQPPLLYALNRV